MLTLQGHGTLHAIYAVVEKACEDKGWDGVDLVIVSGDFQVRTMTTSSWKYANCLRL
jgi:hypothetical protein